MARYPPTTSGDGWEHWIRIKHLADAMPGIAYPRLAEEQPEAVPPEDVGGPWGYRDILDAIADPNNQEYTKRLLQWIGGQFNPTDADVEVFAHAVHSLAKKWTRRPSSRKVPDSRSSATGARRARSIQQSSSQVTLDGLRQVLVPPVGGLECRGETTIVPLRMSTVIIWSEDVRPVRPSDR